ncbi:MAG: FKBP-type peptidyl-prolyl cis-trans isomerase [Bacteroidetes bacterium]|nr:FKBP-type peptidyl-prolyl cis-trans isomerase [Bacteroidota bacterium]
MRYLSKILIGFIVLLFTLNSCDTVSRQTEDTAKKSDETLRESLEKANRYLIRAEDQQIEDYVRRHQLNMTKTGTGLRYAVVQEGRGDSIKKGEVVQFEYVTKLLTGDIIYSSKELGVKQFVVGKGGVESGLEEAVLKFKRGDAAIIILPSHLAFGLLGDEQKIPARSPLIYEIEILKNQ